MSKKKKKTGGQKQKHHRGNPYKKVRYCDPGACHCCQYIGDGDFLCEDHQEIVVADWEPTVAYMICKQGGRSDGGR